MLIRKPVSEVFRAFTDPAVTSRFWFSRGDDALDNGVITTWYWDWFDVSARVEVLAFVQDHSFQIAWGDDGQVVKWHFDTMDAGTLVRIEVSGFPSEPDQAMAEAIDSKGGFTLVLAGAKAFLEHGIEPNLVQDQFPG